MAFNPQQINPLDLNPSTGIGVDIPFNGNAVFKSNFQTKNSIKNNIINYFLTNPGEHYLNPTFGAGLRNFVFEQINDDNLDFLKEDIETKLGDFFPNIKIISLNVLRNDDFNTISIKLNYVIPNTNINDTINIDF
tara:strand:- start:396 stop:800 length:405 start_codon:yes stop_codon:yes gene_type:complete